MGRRFAAAALIGCAVLISPALADSAPPGLCGLVSDPSDDVGIVARDGIDPIAPGAVDDPPLDLIRADVRSDSKSLRLVVVLGEAGLPGITDFGRAYALVVSVGEFRYVLEAKAAPGDTSYEGQAFRALDGPAGVGGLPQHVEVTVDPSAGALTMKVPLSAFKAITGDRVGNGALLHSPRLMSQRFVEGRDPVFGIRTFEAEYSKTDEAISDRDFVLGSSRCRKP